MDFANPLTICTTFMNDDAAIGVGGFGEEARCLTMVLE